MAYYDLDQRGSLSKYQYIHHCIRKDIREGILSGGTRLPSKRTLAKELEVSINTIERAYALLISGGYVDSKQGSGYVVCQGKTDKAFVSAEIGAGETYMGGDTADPPIDLKANRSSLELFPLDTWSRLTRQVLAEKDPRLLETVPFNGLPELRQVIAEYLYNERGIAVSPAQIVIGAGVEYLYGRLLQILGGKQIIAIEDPGYKKFADVSRSLGTLWEYVPLDEEGISVEALRQSRANIVHVSPANHFPTGITMSHERRVELMAWLYEKPNRYIIEDDYDSEIRYGKRAFAPLIAHDHKQRVIYLNTFSKTLVPSLRISYMVLPPALVEIYKRQLSFYSCTVSSFEQATLAKFISGGYFSRHINRLRRYYRQHRQRIFDAFKQSDLDMISTIICKDAGTHFLLRIATRKSEEEIREALHKHGVFIAFLSDYCEHPGAFQSHIMVVNVASIPPHGIQEAIRLLEEVFSDEIREARSLS